MRPIVASLCSDCAVSVRRILLLPADQSILFGRNVEYLKRWLCLVPIVYCLPSLEGLPKRFVSVPSIFAYY